VELKLKQRLMGMVVVASLAIIFLPMLFDGSDEERLRLTTTTIPKPPKISVERVSVAKIKNDMQLLETASTAKLPTEVVDENEYPASEGLTMDENGLPVGWSLQVSSFKDPDNARGLRGEIRSLGHKSYILESRTNQGLFYQVLVGPSLDRTALLKTGHDLAEKLNLTLQITRYRVEDDLGQVGG
jgi:DedD protein